MSITFCQTAFSRRESKSFERPCAHAWGHGPHQMIPCGPLLRVGRERMPNFIHSLHHRRKVAIAPSIATTIIVSTVVDSH
eukprot:5917135-Pyramimonas_sp.AAC.1